MDSRRGQTMKATIVKAVGPMAQRLSLPEKVVQEFVHGTPPKLYRRGEEIFSAGDRQELVHVLGSGAVKIVCDDRVVQIVRPGHVFGLGSLSPQPAPRQFGAVAHETSVVGTASDMVMARLIEGLPPEDRAGLVTYSWRVLSRMLHDSCLLLAVPLPLRILYVLAVYSRAFPVPGAPGMVRLRLTHDDVSALTGASLAAVSKCLKRLRDQQAAFVHRCSLGIARVGTEMLLAAGLGGRAANSPLAVSPASAFEEAPGARARLERVLQPLVARIGFTREAYLAFTAGARIGCWDAGSPIVVDPSENYLSILVSGSALIECEVMPGRRVAVHLARPGRFIGTGWMQDAPGRHRAFRAVAHEPCEVAMIGRDTLAELIAILPPCRTVWFMTYGGRAFSRHLYDKCLFFKMPLNARLLHQLRALAAEFPREHQDGTVIDVSLTTATLAALVVAAPTSVAKCLRALQRARLIRDVESRVLVVGYRVTGRVA